MAKSKLNRDKMIKFIKEFGHEHTANSIAEMFDITDNYAYILGKTVGVKLRISYHENASKRDTLHRIEFIKENPGLTGKELAQKLNMSYRAVIELCYAHNLEFKRKAAKIPIVRMNHNREELFDVNAIGADKTWIM